MQELWLKMGGGGLYTREVWMGFYDTNCGMLAIYIFHLATHL